MIWKGRGQNVTTDLSCTAFLRELDATQRLNRLSDLDVLDSPMSDGFERIVRLIKKIFDVEAALVSMIDAHRQWYKSCHGLDADEVPLEKAFCAHVVAADDAIIVPDATLDPRFMNHPAVISGPKICFYASVPLRTTDGILIGTICAIGMKPRDFGERELDILHELAGAATELLDLQQMANEDSLTTALTRRAFKQAAAQKMRKAERNRKTLGLLILDIDYFKQVNDRLGHAAGDEVLTQVAKICSEHLQEDDLFCRLGGEEFAILLSDTSAITTMALAETLRTTIANRPITGTFGATAVTVSIGCTNWDGQEKAIETVLAEADLALYAAKDDGRNQCHSYDLLTVPSDIGDRERRFLAGEIEGETLAGPVACTIVSIGEKSAGLSVSDALSLPNEFWLLDKLSNQRRHCEVIGRDKRNVEILFHA
jgi:diguanylate cyclase (GGDEF)-like protein